MPHYGILRDHKLEGIDDLRGADVYGVNDEKLGTIDDIIFDHSSGDIRYIVLKTGSLLSRKKVMVPANRVEPYGNHDDKFYAELDKERLDMLPEFDDAKMKAEDDWRGYEKDYEKRWSDGAVMYNKNSGRIITPPPEQVASPAMGASHIAASGKRLDLKPERMGREDDFLGVSSGTNATTLQPKKPSIGGREDVDMVQREREQREIMNPIGEELEIPRGEPGMHTEGMRTEGMRSEAIRSEQIGEPGVYKLDPMIETEQGRGPAETMERGRRWNAFQQNLRSRRDKIVVDCPDCASQDKAA
jgi:sporulation protein YlmC with PRC-barrel domain